MPGRPATFNFAGPPAHTSGSLTYVREAEHADGPRRVVVLCALCGRQSEVDANILRRGNIRRCVACREAASDIRGKRFGRLTAVKPLKERAKNGVAIWRCKCDCGRTHDVARSNLTTRNERAATRSCGQC